MSEVTSERECLQSSLTAATEELSVLRSEWSTAQSDLATLQTQVGGAQRVAEVAEKEVGSLREELAREKDSHSSTRQRLAAAVKVGTLFLPLFPFTLFTLSSSPLLASKVSHLLVASFPPSSSSTLQNRQIQHKPQN